jgi:ATP-dependent Clp protease ATP-binding subunit ClpA
LIIPEPEVPLAVEMIEGLAKRYEDFHQIKIHSEAIGQAVKLSKRYIGDKNLPVSAIEIIDLTLACARQMNDNALQTLEEIEEEWNASDQSKPQVFVQKLKNRISELLLGRIGDELDQTKDISSLISKLKTWAASPKEEVVAEDIESVISYRIGIPLGKLQSKEQDKFKNISEVLSRRVVGQDHVIEAVSKALKSFRTNLKDPKDPGAIFFFVGPTGTGKTELAKSIAELLFDDENSMIRFDMSEFQESHSVAALLGSPPGYVGYEEGGLLVNKIRKQPYSVLLFDEIEKAHGDIYGIFLQMLTDSRLQDKQGRLADFSNTIIIFTSNAGADQMVEAFQKGETLDSERLKQMLRETRRFKDEFLGRVDSQILPFAPISESVALSILKIHFGKFAKILKTQHNINLSATDALLQHLVKLGFSPLFGARPLRNAIKSNLTPVLADLLINGTLQKGDDAEMDLNEAGEIIVHRKAQAVS